MEAAKPPPYKPSPHGEGGPLQRWIGCFRMQHKFAALSPILPAVFHTIVTLSAPSGRLPPEGKAIKLSGRMFLAPHRRL